MYAVKKGLYQWVEISGKWLVLYYRFAWKASRCKVFLVLISHHPIWIRWFTEKISILGTKKTVFGDYSPYFGHPCFLLKRCNTNLDFRIFWRNDAIPKRYHERIINFSGNNFPKKVKPCKAFDTMLYKLKLPLKHKVGFR